MVSDEVRKEFEIEDPETGEKIMVEMTIKDFITYKMRKETIRALRRIANG